MNRDSRTDPIALTIRGVIKFFVCLHTLALLALPKDSALIRACSTDYLPRTPVTLS